MTDPTTWERHAEITRKIAAGLRKSGKREEADTHDLYAMNYQRYASDLRGKMQQPEHRFWKPGEVVSFLGFLLILGTIAVGWIGTPA